MKQYDLAVIGAGSAGLSVAYAAARLGLRVALIERGRMGGDCLNTGCVPSKALLAASHAAAAVRGAGRFGIDAAAPAVAWDRVRAHVQGAIAAIAPADSAERYAALGATVLQGHARFAGLDALDVDGQRITARRIVVAAGSRAAVPDVPGLEGSGYLTNETLFDLASAPRHLLILGGGPIGLEMAQAHAALGCRVTLVQKGRIAPKDEPELVEGLRGALRACGVVLHENAEVAGVEAGHKTDGQETDGQETGGQETDGQEEGGPVLVLADGRRIGGSHLLVAAGRVPNLEGLALEAGRVRATARGVATDAGLRSLTNRIVYAAGDIADPAGIGPRYFTHVGSTHAGIVVRRALFRVPAKVDYGALPRVTYTWPELAQTGRTEAEARAAGMEVEVLHWSMAENDRAVTEAETGGLVKLVVAGNRVVGAGILAPHAGEMIGQWTLAIQEKTGLGALAGMIVPYPTRSEAGKRAIGAHLAKRLFAPRARGLVRLLARLP